MIRKVWILFLVIFFLGAALVDAGTVQLQKTGQTTSYSTGDDGDLERGVAWPIPQFTDQGNGTVTDNLTGLIWTKNANFPGTYKTWQQALDYVKGMNAGTYSNFGYTDWRLPNRKELQSLIDRSRYNPALPSGHPFTNVQVGGYWSSTSCGGYSYYAWVVTMNYGFVSNYSKSVTFFVWPVRSGQVGPSVHSILGSVTENGIGIGGVTLTLSGCASSTTDTASDGSYSFTDLADGDCTITPSLEGHAFIPPSRLVTVAGADVTGQDFSAVQTWFEENDPAIAYTGTWNTFACPPCSNGSFNYSGQTGAKAEFSFYGTGIRWTTARAPVLGKAKIYFNGVYKGMVDLYSPVVQYPLVLEGKGLPPNNYTLTIEVSGQKNPGSTGYYTIIDAFEVIP